MVHPVACFSFVFAAMSPLHSLIIIKSSFKSGENIQKKEGGSDRSVLNNKFS